MRKARTMTSVPQVLLLSKLKVTRWLWGSMWPLQLGSFRCKVEKSMPLSASRHPARVTVAEPCLQTGGSPANTATLQVNRCQGEDELK